jgi:hypothetical protein
LLKEKRRHLYVQKNELPMPSPAGLLKTTSYLLLLVLQLRLLHQ